MFPYRILLFLNSVKRNQKFCLKLKFEVSDFKTNTYCNFFLKILRKNFFSLFRRNKTVYTNYSFKWPFFNHPDNMTQFSPKLTQYIEGYFL